MRLAAAAPAPCEAAFLTAQGNPELALDLCLTGAGLREGLDMFPLPRRWDSVEFEGGPGAAAVRLVVSYPLKGNFLGEIAEAHEEVMELIERSIGAASFPASDEEFDALKPQLVFVLSSDESVLARSSSHMNGTPVARDPDLMRRLKAFFEAPDRPITLLYRSGGAESQAGTAVSDLGSGSGSPSASQARPVKISRAPGAIPVRGLPTASPATPATPATPAAATATTAPATAPASAPAPAPTAAESASTVAGLGGVVDKTPKDASGQSSSSSSSQRKERAPQPRPASPSRVSATESHDVWAENLRELDVAALEAMTVNQLAEHAREARPDVFRAHFSVDEDGEPKKEGRWKKSDLVAALVNPARAAAADASSQPGQREAEHGGAEASDDEELRTGVIAFGDGPSFKQPKSQQQLGTGKGAPGQASKSGKPNKSPAPEDSKGQAGKTGKAGKADEQPKGKAAAKAAKLREEELAEEERARKAAEAQKLERSEAKRNAGKADEQERMRRSLLGTASEGKRKATKSDAGEPVRKAAESEEKHTTAAKSDEEERAREPPTTPKKPHATTVSALLKESKVGAEAKGSPVPPGSSSASSKGKRKPTLDFTQSSLESEAAFHVNNDDEAGTGTGMGAGYNASLRSSAASLALRTKITQASLEPGGAAESILASVRQVAVAVEALTVSTTDAARKAEAQGSALRGLQQELTAQRSQVEDKAGKAAAELAQRVASIDKSLGRLESVEKGLQQVGAAVCRELDQALSPIQARLASGTTTPGSEGAAQPALVQQLAEVRQQQQQTFERFDGLLQQLLGTQRKVAEQVQQQGKLVAQEMQTLLQQQQQQHLQHHQQQHLHLQQHLQQLRLEQQQPQPLLPGLREQGQHQTGQLQLALPDVELPLEARALLAKVEALSSAAAAEVRPTAEQLARVAAGAQQALEAARADAAACVARTLKTFKRDAGRDAEAKLRAVQSRKRQLTLEAEATIDMLQVKRARLGELHVQHMEDEAAHLRALDALAAKVDELGERKRHEEKKATEELAARTAAGQAALKRMQTATKNLVADMHTKLETRRNSFQSMKRAIETATTA